MRIRSTTVDGHQFTRTRRGYDAAEVDAVMARIADTLREYEDQADELESRIAAAETAARVSRSKAASPDAATEVAREHAGDIVRHAEEEATRRKAEIAALLEAARREAEELRLETEEARARVEADRAAIESERDTALRDAEAIRSEAEADAHAVRLAATRRAEDLGLEAEEARARVEADRVAIESERDAALRDAEADAHAIRLAATREAQALLSAALDEARALRADAARDAAEMRARLLAEAEEEMALRRDEAEKVHLHAAERARHTAEVLSSAEADRRELEGRLTNLREAVRTIEDQMQNLAGEIAAKVETVDELARPSDVSSGADADTGDQTPSVDPGPSAQAGDHDVATTAELEMPDEYAPMAIAEPSATIVVDDTDVAAGASADTHTSSHHHAYAEPDGSGRPPADRATIVPEDLTAIPPPEDHQGPDRTVYQRAGRNLRARLRREGQDPTQRGR